MHTVFSHAFAGAALAALFRLPHRPARVVIAGSACAVLPDADVIGLWFGMPWGHGLGHLAAAPHGLLDALTDGGSGVAFFAPFEDTRYFLLAADPGVTDQRRAIPE